LGVRGYGEDVTEEERPRIAPGTRAEIGLVNAAIARVIGLAAGGPPPRIFTTLARNRRIFRRWLWFAGGLMPGGKLPRADTELVILRVAHLTGSNYEWAQHERIAARTGLSTEEIERVRQGPGGSGWTARQRLLLAAVDESHADGRIGDATWAGLAAELDEPLLIELCLLIGHYEMLAMTLASLGVRPEPPGRRLG
jgi:AhpD family alkylhydroperoxidase